MLGKILLSSRRSFFLSRKVFNNFGFLAAAATGWIFISLFSQHTYIKEKKKYSFSETYWYVSPARPDGQTQKFVIDFIVRAVAQVWQVRGCALIRKKKM